MGVTEWDRKFAGDILEDFSTFEEGIENQEKLAQWIRNVRRGAAQTGQQWQPIETAPNHGEVLLWWKHAGMGVGSWDDEGNGWRCEGDDCVPKNQSDCTHWMPKPASPSDTSTDRPPDYKCENCIGMIEHGCYCKAMGATAPGGAISSQGK